MRDLLPLLALLLLPACAPTSDADATQQADALPWAPPDQVGPYGVVTAEEEISSEGVSVALQVWYPGEDMSGAPAAYDGFSLNAATAGTTGAAACATPRPVVVFSHGNEGVRWQSFFLTERLASHGFLVAAPDHTGNTLLDADSARLPEIILRRPLDVQASFDRLLARSADPQDPLYGCVDPSAGYAVVGHSFGGYTAYATAGAALDVAAGRALCAAGQGWLCDELDVIAEQYGEDAIIDHSDPRVWASVPMSPAGIELLKGGLASITVPVMSLSGDADDLTTPDLVRALYAEVRAEKDLGFLAGAGHYTFSDACEILPTGTFCGGDIDLTLAHERISTAVVTRLRMLLGDDAAGDLFPPADAEWAWE